MAANLLLNAQFTFIYLFDNFYILLANILFIIFIFEIASIKMFSLKYLKYQNGGFFIHLSKPMFNKKISIKKCITVIS